MYIYVYIYIFWLYIHTGYTFYIQGVLQKSISNLICSYLEMYQINSTKIFTVVKIFHCLTLEAFIAQINLISNYCQFLMGFINRTRVLVGIVVLYLIR